MAQYEPRPFPSGLSEDELRLWFEEELRRISEVLEQVENVVLEELHEEPAKRQVGMIALADGTDWNPGSGQGVYWWNGTAWQFMG